MVEGEGDLSSSEHQFVDTPEGSSANPAGANNETSARDSERASTAAAAGDEMSGGRSSEAVPEAAAADSPGAARSDSILRFERRPSLVSERI